MNANTNKSPCIYYISMSLESKINEQFIFRCFKIPNFIE